MTTTQDSSPSPDTTPSIKQALQAAKARIRNAETAFGRPQNSVTLLAVSKTKPAQDIVAAIEAGQTEFGENYLDEALLKQQALTGNRDIVWHYIGAIQSNKTAQLSRHFDWVHSVAREKIAQRLSSQRPADLPPLNCCIQVNIDDEQSKSGITPEALPALAAFMQTLDNIRLRGLMVIPAATQGLESQRKSFARVQQLYKTLQNSHPSVDTLSMGMSGDIEAAIAEGSTMVRMGTAIFGARPLKR